MPLYMCRIEERQEEEDDPKKIIDVYKRQAEDIKKQLEEVGAKVTVK